MSVRPLALAAALLATVAAPALAQSPLPASDLAITWGAPRVVPRSRGGDIWPTATRPDGQVEAAWGDGRVTCSVKVAFGTLHLPAKPSAKMTADGCGPQGSRGGKILALRYIGSTLWALLDAQNRPEPKPDIRLLRSTDGGRQWRYVGLALSTTLRPGAMLPAGPDGGFTYLLLQKPSNTPHEVYLGRVANSNLAKLRSAILYFTGADADGSNPTWGAAADAKPVISGVDPFLDYPALEYLTGPKRFVVTAGFGAPDTSAVFDAPHPWGPYTTVEFVEKGWLGRGSGGERQKLTFPEAWQTATGGTAVAGCYGAGCGDAADSMQLIPYTLGPAAGPPPPVPDPVPVTPAAAASTGPTPAPTAIAPATGTTPTKKPAQAKGK
jgi:hypothetical protein